jgi:hypothetical protein
MDTTCEDQLIMARLRHYYSGRPETDVRLDLESKYGESWNDAELLTQFGVQYFDGPVVHVIRKTDGQRGTVAYVDEPRLYFSFIPTVKKETASE